MFQALADNDQEHNGRVVPNVLLQVLNDYTLRLSNDHFNQLCNKFQPSHDGSILIKDFFHYFKMSYMGMENLDLPSERYEEKNDDEVRYY